jgi:hypothetical protein
MKQSFDTLFFSNSEKVGLCIASGPSLRNYLKLLKHISIFGRNRFCLFSVNDIDKWYDFHSDFRVLANSEQTIFNSFLNLRRHKNTKIVFAESVDLTPRWVYSLLLFGINYLIYDQRHFLGQSCIPVGDCCKRIVKNKLTIQEELQKYCNYDRRYGSGHTVALHMLAISILCGCKEIYVFGVDLDYKKGYVKKGIVNIDSFDFLLEEILDDFSIIFKSALNIGVKIFSCSENSPINSVIPFKDFNENC